MSLDVHWIKRLLQAAPDIEAVPLIEAVATRPYQRPPVAEDSAGKIVKGIGARDAQIRALNQEIFELRLLLASLICLLVRNKTVKAPGLEKMVEELQLKIGHWEVGGLPANEEAEQ